MRSDYHDWTLQRFEIAGRSIIIELRSDTEAYRQTYSVGGVLDANFLENWGPSASVNTFSYDTDRLTIEMQSGGRIHATVCELVREEPICFDGR